MSSITPFESRSPSTRSRSRVRLRRRSRVPLMNRRPLRSRTLGDLRARAVRSLLRQLARVPLAHRADLVVLDAPGSGLAAQASSSASASPAIRPLSADPCARGREALVRSVAHVRTPERTESLHRAVPSGAPRRPGSAGDTCTARRSASHADRHVQSALRRRARCALGSSRSHSRTTLAAPLPCALPPRSSMPVSPASRAMGTVRSSRDLAAHAPSQKGGLPDPDARRRAVAERLDASLPTRP